MNLEKQNTLPASGAARGAGDGTKAGATKRAARASRTTGRALVLRAILPGQGPTVTRSSKSSACSCVGVPKHCLRQVAGTA